MKVIGFTSNYGEQQGQELQCYLMADSSILYTGRPFFLPDFAQSFVATPSIVVRTGRLGKCIASKFAHRYWDAFAAAFIIRAVNGDDERLKALDTAFDGALVVGQWVENTPVSQAMATPVQLAVNGNVVARCCLDDMCWPLEQLLSAVSVRCSIKMGDILVTGDASQPITLAAGDRLTAVIDGTSVLDVKVRL